MAIPKLKVYRTLARAVYEQVTTNHRIEDAHLLENGFRSAAGKIYHLNNAESLQCGAFKVFNTDLIIIAIRGTEKTSIHNIGDDLRIIAGGMPHEFLELVKFSTRIMSQNKGKQFHFTGHSLGGMLAQMAGAAFNCFHVGWNGPGVAHPFFRYTKTPEWKRLCDTNNLLNCPARSVMEMNKLTGINLAVKEDNIGNAYGYNSPEYYVGRKIERSNGTISPSAMNLLYNHMWGSIDSAFEGLMDKAPSLCD